MKSRFISGESHPVVVKIDDKQDCHPQRHFSISITTITLQNSHRLTTRASTPATACKVWFLFICHSKEAQKPELLFIINPFSMHRALALRALMAFKRLTFAVYVLTIAISLFTKSMNKVLMFLLDTICTLFMFFGFKSTWLVDILFCNMLILIDYG